ncbi:SymE family type I addiction module toxin [Morganella morganii]|uniref:SymE family type I addiction module toxin n=1 Tax=Morganella morganii TaxID=582 RepID=UPI0032AEF685
MLHGQLCPERQKQQPAITLKWHWLKAAGFETGFIFTVKILNGCLVLIPDSEDIRAIK